VPAVRRVDLQHLRRVIKYESLPPPLLERWHVTAVSSTDSASPGSLDTDEGQCKPQLGAGTAISRGATSVAASPGAPRVTGPTAAAGADTRVLLASPTALISLSDLTELLRNHSSFAGLAPLEIRTTTVPAVAPVSDHQAQEWSRSYWPSMYRNTNPYGPHPSIVSRSEAEINPVAGKCLALAERVAEETSELGLGVQCGCIVTSPDPHSPSQSKIIAAAGDARWCGPSQRDHGKKVPGNVAAHAVMRAIGMIAQKRRQFARQVSSPYSTKIDGIDDALVVQPRTPLEICISALSQIEPNGYLCTDLDIYVTHEPCVMCSMAILHSRFKRCIIGSRTAATGGIVADSGLQHGIFWRPSELNWKLLSWEWSENNDTRAPETHDDMTSF
jgi:tRNA-specific adenosine deaminase 3